MIFDEETARILNISSKNTIDSNKIGLEATKMVNNIEEHEKKMAEWCDEYNKEELNKMRQRIEELKKENEELKAKLGDDSGLKAPVPSYKTLWQPGCCEFYKPISDDPYKNAFDILKTSRNSNNSHSEGE